MNGCATCGGFGDRHDPIAHGTERERECQRQPDAYVKPRYPVDEPPTYRAQCCCGWAGPERYHGITDMDWRRHLNGDDQ